MRHIALIILFVSIGFSSACTFNIKTPIVADYQQLETIQLSRDTRDDIQIKIGEPQGVGIHRIGETSYELVFYFGFAGVFSMSSAQYDSGTVLLSYQDRKPIYAVYYLSSAKGPEVKLDMEIPVKQIANKLRPEITNINEMFDILGKPAYQGRRISAITGISHQIAYYDVSKVLSNGSVKEKWLLLGYDDKNVIQDVMWVSSFSEDIKEFGEVSEKQSRQITRTQIAGFFPVDQPVELDTGKRIDPFMVESLLTKSPTNVSAMKDVLGQPTAIGIKTFEGERPMILSNWSQGNIKVIGKEHNFIPYSTSEEERKHMAPDTSYMVMKTNQTRLIVGHDKDGTIREILWFRPISN